MTAHFSKVVSAFAPLSLLLRASWLRPSNGRSFVGTDPWQRSRGQQFVNLKAKPFGNLLQREQPGILLQTDFVKLVKFIANTAGFCGLFLCPSASQPQFPQSLSESF